MLLLPSLKMCVECHRLSCSVSGTWNPRKASLKRGPLLFGKHNPAVTAATKGSVRIGTLSDTVWNVVLYQTHSIWWKFWLYIAHEQKNCHTWPLTSDIKILAGMLGEIPLHLAYEMHRDQILQTRQMWEGRCSETVKYTEIKFYCRPVRCEMNPEAGLGEIGEIYTAARCDRQCMNMAGSRWDNGDTCSCRPVKPTRDACDWLEISTAL